MKIESYHHFGGRHYETAALRNTLAWAGAIDPFNGQPLSEAMCLGVAGGITAGYSFCPSIPSHETGSGVGIVGRYRVYITGPEYYQGCLSRLRASIEVRESGSEKAAFKHLREALEAGRPAIVWNSPIQLPWADWWSGTYGMYTMVVFGIDESSGEALIGDRAPAALRLPLEVLSESRARVCSHKNRLMTFRMPAPLSRETLRNAVEEGISACAMDMLEPKLKTYSLPGLQELGKVIANQKNKKGWPQVYPDGNYYPALRDVFDSIETASTGGGLFRPMYAEFLEEAATVTGRDALKMLASTYRALGERWTALAEAALPAGFAPFEETKRLLRERLRLFETEGAAALERIGAIKTRLRGLDTAMKERFPMGEEEAHRHLEALGKELLALHGAELEAALQLRSAVV